jgi:hypothetical protein
VEGNIFFHGLAHLGRNAIPATSTDTSEPSECRIPRGLRGSVSRAASTSRSAAGTGGAPAAPEMALDDLDQG